MKNKFEPLLNLSPRDLLNSALISKLHYTLYSSILNSCKLLHYVTRGEYKIVKAMLTNAIELIFEQGIVTDLSGRKFENISPFEYILWATDKPMRTVMLNCIHQNHKKLMVIEKLQSQYKRFKEKGVTYWLNGKSYTEWHFDFEGTVIKELQTQINLFNASNGINWDEANLQWIKGVGGAQNLLPLYVVVYVYCNNKRFNPLLDFTEESPLATSRKFYNRDKEREEDWFAADSKLGEVFAVLKECGAAGKWVWRSKSSILNDLEDMKALSSAITNDFINIELQLENLAQDTTSKITNNIN